MPWTAQKVNAARGEFAASGGARVQAGERRRDPKWLICADLSHSIPFLPCTYGEVDERSEDGAYLPSLARRSLGVGGRGKVSGELDPPFAGKSRHFPRLAGEEGGGLEGAPTLLPVTRHQFARPGGFADRAARVEARHMRFDVEDRGAVDRIEALHL